MLLASSLILWIALPAAVHLALVRVGRPAIPSIAGLMAAALGAAGTVQLTWLETMPASRQYHDTYYVVSQGYFLLNMAIFYLVVAGFALLIWKLARGWIKRLLSPAFWVYHIGVAAVVMPTLLLWFYVPRRYVDYPDTIYWFGLISGLGAQLSLLGMAVLLSLAAIALAQRIWQGRTT